MSKLYLLDENVDLKLAIYDFNQYTFCPLYMLGGGVKGLFIMYTWPKKDWLDLISCYILGCPPSPQRGHP